MTVGIYYVPEAYSTDAPKLMGRNAAGESFLKGFLKYSRKNDDLWIQVEREEHARDFEKKVASNGRKENVRAFTNASLGNAKTPGVVYFPGPGIGQHATMRRFYGDSAWSLCGITHTTSSATAMDAISDLLTAPVQPWDAVICTSNAVKKNVEQLLESKADYLLERLGATKIVMPNLPVVPLGIHAEEFSFPPAKRQTARIELGATDDSLVVLYTGRLSFHAKAHPLAMYQALELASKQTNKSIILLECGWHANDYIKNAFAEAASITCPSVRVINLDGRVATERANAWASADVFCSLSDNIQETFGIVPLEAMAAGLPVIVSDWDGYKDTVRDGVDGYRIPTIGPKPGLGGDLAQNHALGIDTYDMYCGYSSSLIAMHSQKLTQAFINLFTSAELRQAMGAAGKERARLNYDWRVIIPRYEDLWQSLSELRIRAKSEGLKESRVWPARLDPTISFSHYPTTVLGLDTLLTMTHPTVSEAIGKINQYKNLSMIAFASLIFPTQEEIQNMLEVAALSGGDPVKAESLIAVITEPRRAFALRGLAWLTKLGVFHFS